MLSGVMMFDFMGWKEVGQLIEAGIERTIAQKRVTYDLERMMEGATKVTTSAFCDRHHREYAVAGGGEVGAPLLSNELFSTSYIQSNRRTD